MSGHSKWATIHRQKEANDSARGQVFSKLARAITIAAKTGGGPDPDTNFKLRVLIEKARASNMPKDNIERAISKASGGEVLDEVTYEGFGPGGIGIIVEAGTDNRNRTGNEIKNIFDKGGGKFAGPGAVSFNFEPKGQILVEKKGAEDEQMLSLIDLGAEDVEFTDDGVEVYTSPATLFEVQKKIADSGFNVKSTEMVQKPKMYQEIDENDSEKAGKLLTNLNAHDDVQKVYTNWK